MKNTGISGVARRYLLRIIFYKHSMFAGSAKRSQYSFEIFVRKPLEN